MEASVQIRRAQLAAGGDADLPAGRTRCVALEALLRSCEGQPDLLDADHFPQRIEVLDRLEVMLEAAADFDGNASEAALSERARILRSRLELANAGLFAAVRREIQDGRGPAALAPWIREELEPYVEPGLAYDWRDDLMAGILDLAEPDGPVSHAGHEMVFYQPTPARHVFELLRRVKLGPEDVLVDLGSGLGHVHLLVAIATPAAGIGIERDAAFVAVARRCAHNLGLSRATIVQADAREADLSAGTVFYLHTPFTGSILKDVLDRLRSEAEQRPIRVATFGPCTSVVTQEPWLAATSSSLPHRISLFISQFRKA